MPLPFCITRRLCRAMMRLAKSREPDFVIGGAENPYMRRWFVVPRNRWANIYLHQILRDDDSEALHDHPWINVSIILKGMYAEVRPLPGADPREKHLHVKSYYAMGDIVVRLPSAAHRLEVVTGRGVWSLFLTGPKVREWGFFCAHGWRHWKDFVDARDTGSVGRGCE